MSSQTEAMQEEQEKERKHRIHNSNLSAPTQDQHGGSTAEILRILSEIDDLPIQPQEDAVMGQLVSKLTSTANLTAEQVKSNEWVREYILVLYLCKHPSKDGLHGPWRAWAHDDVNEFRDPLSAEKRMELETFVTSSKLGLTRSEDFRAVEESTRNVQESYVHDDSDDSGRGGLLGRWRS